MPNIVIPKLVGSRLRAAELAEHSLPRDLTGQMVEVDASSLSSAAQSFADELCKQVLELRNADFLSVHHATPRFGQHLSASARLRGMPERLNVDIRVA